MPDVRQVLAGTHYGSQFLTGFNTETLRESANGSQMGRAKIVPYICLITEIGVLPVILTIKCIWETKS